MKSSILRAKSLILAGTLIFTITGIGTVHAAEGYDMSDEVAAGDSAAVRDTYVKGQDKSIKERLHMKGSKRDNSRYTTDGTERFEDEDQSDKEYSGTGPKRKGRY